MCEMKREMKCQMTVIWLDAMSSAIEWVLPSISKLRLDFAHIFTDPGDQLQEMGIDPAREPDPGRLKASIKI